MTSTSTTTEDPELGPRALRLMRARVAGVVGLSVVAQVGIDMPEGYFGPEDQVTEWGLLYSVAVAIVFALTVWRRERGPSWQRRWLLPLVLVFNALVFLPALTADPLVTGLVVGWSLYLATGYVLPPLRPWPVALVDPEDEVSRWVGDHGPALRHLSAMGLALAVGVAGYRFADHAAAVVVCLGLSAGALLYALPLLWRLRRSGSVAAYLPLAAGGLAVATATRGALGLVFLAVAQGVVLVILASRHESTLVLLRTFYERPSRLVVVSFLGVVLIGTVLLTFPVASATGVPVSPLDALFTATSATCVTGLIVLDTPNDFSLFGQAVILLLIQVGGLGIMVLSTFAMILLGGRLGLRGERALSDMLEQGSASGAYELTRFIVLVTLAVESVGALALAFFFRAEGFSVTDSLWRGVFHSVSAFCNAGFALQTDSLTLFADDPLPLLVVAALIVLGGLGFAVLAGLAQRFGRRGHARGLTLHVRSVTAVSGVLIVAGTLLFLGLEWSRSLDSMGPAQRIANAVFQSVTLRTAGFNTVDMSGLAAATVVFMLVFMFVGGSPGSTAGGVKTTTVLVLLAALRAGVVGEEEVRVLDREVPHDVVRRSVSIVLLFLMLATMGIFLLAIFEDQPLDLLVFEGLSAFGTVGLSLGATGALGPAGKMIVIVMMFIGRIGPLTLALFLGRGPGRGSRVRLPESRLMVG